MLRFVAVPEEPEHLSLGYEYFANLRKKILKLIMLLKEMNTFKIQLYLLCL
jgi:hypothetical protein